MNSCVKLLLAFGFFSYLPMSHGDTSLTASEIIQAAMDNWRGVTSYSEVSMIIKRRDWQRSLSMRAWTEGDKKSLVRVTLPKKDAGNATLTDDINMWTFSPKINRVIKVPSSMMSQSWMGSDFSNKDIGRSTDILDHYDHKLVNTEIIEGRQVYTIEAIPHEDAPVVWGKEVMKIREDFVMLNHQFWDQDEVLVKEMKTMEIAQMGGRTVSKILRMYSIDSPDEYTELHNHHIEFNVGVPGYLFTLSNLRNPRR